MRLRRSVVSMTEGAPKTKASFKDVPVDAQTTERLWTWKLRSIYPAPGDWVFTSPYMKGKQPYWQWQTPVLQKESRELH
jgi:hypothetical protein